MTDWLFQASRSTEELNNEMRNLESVMKDLNAITGNPQRIPPHPLHITCNTQCWAFIHSFIHSSCTPTSVLDIHQFSQYFYTISRNKCEVNRTGRTYSDILYISCDGTVTTIIESYSILISHHVTFYRVTLHYKPITWQKRDLWRELYNASQKCS